MFICVESIDRAHMALIGRDARHTQTRRLASVDKIEFSVHLGPHAFGGAANLWSWKTNWGERRLGISRGLKTVGGDGQGRLDTN